MPNPLAALLIVLMSLLSACASAQQDPGAPPNIIVFLVDDMGWQDTSVAFHTERTVWNDLYRTPNMQRLADRGMVFTNAYASCTVCSPTRVSLLTGQNPARHGVTDWVGHGSTVAVANKGTDREFRLRSPEWAADGLQPSPNQQTLPAILARHGYLTAHVGKAHFGGGGTPGEDPATLGFQINIAGSHAGSPRGQGPGGSYFAPFPPDQHPGLQAYPEGVYLTDALTLEAIKVVDHAIDQNQPFFINLAHYAIHAPIKGQGDPARLAHYDDDRPGVEQDYAAMIESMDASLGAVLDHLETRGIADNTVIFFLSDNGGLSNHSRANTPEADTPWKTDRHNSPLSSGKGSGYDGGTRVPMIVAWAGGSDTPGSHVPAINPGSRCDTPAITHDILPTVLHLARIQNPIAPDQLDGIDLSPLLVGGTLDDRSLLWHYPHMWYRDIDLIGGVGIRPYSAVRLGDFKLIYFYAPDGGTLALYNIPADPGEHHDLAADPAYQDDLARLARALVDRLKATHAAFPIDAATGAPVNTRHLTDAAR